MRSRIFYLEVQRVLVHVSWRHLLIMKLTALFLDSKWYTLSEYSEYFTVFYQKLWVCSGFSFEVEGVLSINVCNASVFWKVVCKRKRCKYKKKTKTKKRLLSIWVFFLNMNFSVIYQHHNGENVFESLSIKIIFKKSKSKLQLLTLPSCLYLSLDIHLTVLSHI